MTNTFDEYVEKAVRLSLAKPALPALQQLIGLLVDHDITPLHLHADSIATEQPRASLTLWTHTRTEIERLAAAMGCRRRRGRSPTHPLRGASPRDTSREGRGGPPVAGLRSPTEAAGEADRLERSTRAPTR